MTEYAAIDLGASSGRVVAGTLDAGRVRLQELHRFPNRPVRLPDGLRWNLLHAVHRGARGAARGARSPASASTPGASTTRCSTATAGCSGCRSTTATTRTEGMVERALRSASRAPSCYAVTGIQTMPINTVFQLLADEGSAALAAARARSRSCPTCSPTG